MTLATPKRASATGLKPRVLELLTMLQYKRPAYSKAEAAFIRRYVEPLGTVIDGGGNHWVTVGHAPTILWSSHTDTVHNKGGPQRVQFGDGIASTDDGNCLGADCTVGVWIMANMIRAGIPGAYVFHAAEEIGGVGSQWVAESMPDRLRPFRHAIAFDRAGTHEIITHQGGLRCASDNFAYSLADALGMHLAPSDGGTFTDTANYMDIIPECTNIAVGYYDQHRKTETLDVRHAERLLDAILKADLSRLVVERDPSVVEGLWSSPHDTGRFASGAWTDRKERELIRLCKSRPELVAAFLGDSGFTAGDIEDYDLGSSTAPGWRY